MSHIHEETPQEKLSKARILINQVGCIVDFVDLDHLTIDNTRGEDLGLSAFQLRGLLLLLDHANDVLSDVKRLIAESGLLTSTESSRANDYIDSAQAIFDVSRELFALHREQECHRDRNITELSAIRPYVGGFFCGLNKVDNLVYECWDILNDAYEQALSLQEDHIKEVTA